MSRLFGDVPVQFVQMMRVMIERIIFLDDRGVMLDLVFARHAIGQVLSEASAGSIVANQSLDHGLLLCFIESGKIDTAIR